MNCWECEKECLLTGDNLSSKARAHLKECEDCRKFAHAAALANCQLDTMQVKKTENTCLDILKMAGRKRESLLKKIFKWWTVAAAVVTVMVGVVYSMNGHISIREEGISEYGEFMAEMDDAPWRLEMSELQDGLNELEVSVGVMACGL